MTQQQRSIVTGLNLGEIEAAAGDLLGVCSEAGYRDAVGILIDAVPSLLAAARANARIEAMVAVWEADEREYLMRFGQHIPCSLATLSEAVRAALGTEQEGRTE